MMTVSESSYASSRMSTVHKVNDKVVLEDNSSTSDSALVTKRGFKPSDMFDPRKKEFLTNLSYKLFPNDLPKSRDPSPTEFLDDRVIEVERESINQRPEEFNDAHSPITIGGKEIDLNKIFTPAPDAEEHLIKKSKSSFASSAFYASGLHPTVKEQVELARKISSSLSEPANQLSKGQSMYVNRKKRSEKWVHEGKGRNTSNSCMTPTPSSTHDTAYRPPNTYNKQQGKYNTFPRPNTPKNTSVNVLPKMEPFPTAPVTTLTPLPDLYIPPLQTKLSDAYSSPSSGKSPQWMNGKNYNTAARGWGQIRDFYRPVTFDDQGYCNSLPFSDF